MLKRAAIVTPPRRVLPLTEEFHGPSNSCIQVSEANPPFFELNHDISEGEFLRTI
jgi:hypothetical protein